MSRDVMLGSLPGISLLLCGKLSGWAVGSADGIIVLVLGIYLGFWQVLSVLSGAFLTAVMAAGFLLAVKKKDRKYEIPFIPFLFAGMMFSLSLIHICGASIIVSSIRSFPHLVLKAFLKTLIST